MITGEWVIEAARGRNIQLTFITFEVEEEKACSYDYVEVYSGVDDSSGRLHGRYCGNAVRFNMKEVSKA